MAAQACVNATGHRKRPIKPTKTQTAPCGGGALVHYFYLPGIRRGIGRHRDAACAAPGLGNDGKRPRHGEVHVRFGMSLSYKKRRKIRTLGRAVWQCEVLVICS